MLALFPKVPTIQRLTSSITPLSFDASSPGNPANILIKLILRETRVIARHLRRHSVGLSSFRFSLWAPKNAYFM